MDPSAIGRRTPDVVAAATAALVFRYRSAYVAAVIDDQSPRPACASHCVDDRRAGWLLGRSSVAVRQNVGRSRRQRKKYFDDTKNDGYRGKLRKLRKGNKKGT